MTTQEQHTLSAVIQVARQLDRVPSVRDAMSVLDEESIRSGSSISSAGSSSVATHATTPASSGSSTSLAPGPMELGATEASREPKFSSCARCGGRGHWSTVCPTPRNWKETDPIVDEGMPRRGNQKRFERGGKHEFERGRRIRGKGAQAHNTEAESDGKGVWDEDVESSGNSEEEEGEEEQEDQGKA